jgi:hypothetical protein
MRIKLNYITPLLAAGAIAAAPTAAAAPAPAPTERRSCTGAICQSPGNVEINNAPPSVSYRPYGDMPYLLGGHGGLRGSSH